MRGIQRVDEEAGPSNLIGDVRLAALAAALLATFGAASAQQPPAPDSAASRAGVSERTLRDAESPMRWIKIHSESLRRSEEVRRAAAAAAQAASAAPARTVAAKPAPAKPQRTATADTRSAAPAAGGIAAANTAAAPAQADSANEERSLVTVDRSEPEWDEDLIRSLRKGRVVVRFVVAEDGYLSRIQIVESTNSRLTGPAMAAVMQWRFEPVTEPRVATVEFGFDVESGRH